jgi:hypothetical protein
MKHHQHKSAQPRTGAFSRARHSWEEGLNYGLPSNFDFGVVRTVDDAMTLISTLPNSDRGEAAKSLYEYHDVGNRVAYRGLILAWEHDHQELISAFGSQEELADALRSVSPPSKRKKPVRAWRGVDNVEGAFGMSWTTNRDIACWFAMRRFAYGPRPTPCVLVCDLDPAAIVAEHNGRDECELIVDPFELDTHAIFLDDGREDPYEISKFDDECHKQVASAEIEGWRLGYNRYEAAKKAKLIRGLRKHGSPLRTP